MDNKHISNTTEASLEGLLNNCSQPNVHHATNNSYFTEKNFEDFVNRFNMENNSHYHDESSDSEDSASKAYKYIDNKNEKQQDVKCELAFTSYEKDVNVSESNSQEFTNTKLVDGKIISMQTNFPSTALPIMKILSPKSGPHICLECCFKCNKVFRVLDSPSHIKRIRSIDKKNEFFKTEPSLCDDSCLCDSCWYNLEKTYKSIKSNNRKKETYSEKKSRFLERYAKKNVSKNQARRCSIHLCSRSYCQKMTVNEFENIKKLFLTFECCHLVFVQSTKKTKDFLKFPFRLCKIHMDMILVMSTCQICGDKLNAPFNTDDWSMYETWNFVLIENHLPLILKPAMFLCVTCKRHISKNNPGFPTIDLPRLREYILKSNAIRLELYGELQYNLFNIYQGPTYLTSPIVFPNIKEEKEFVHLTKVKFSDPLITRIYNYEIDFRTADVSDSKRFSETNSEEILPNCGKKETDYIIVASNDDLRLDSHSELIKSKFETKPAYEMEINKNDTKSITSTASINVAEQNLITPRLELKDEGHDIVEHGEEYFKTYYNSLQSSCQVNSVEIVENKSGILSSHQVVCTHDEIENNQSKLNSNDICSVAHNRSSMDLPYTPKLELQDEGLDIVEDGEEYFKTYYNSLQSSCQVISVEIVENESGILSSRQVVGEHNEIENNQSKLNSNDICSVAQNRSSMDLPYTPKLELQDEGLDIVEDGEEYFKTYYNSLQSSCQVNSVEIVENESGILSSRQVVGEHNEIENNQSKLNSNDICSVAQNRSSMDLPYTPKLELKDEGLDILEHEEEYFKTYYNSLQSSCQVNSVEIVENESGILSSRQVVGEHNEIENNQSKLNSNDICSVAQNRSSMDLPYTPKLELKDEGLDILEHEEEYFKTYYNSLQSSCQVNSVEIVENKSGILSSHQVVCTHDEIENNQSKLNSNDICSVAHNRSSMDLPYTPKLELKDEGLDILEHEEEYFKTYYNSLQSSCQVNSVEIVENKSGILSSRQVVGEHNEIENNQSKLNSNDICSVAQNRSSMYLKEGNQCINKINTIPKSVYLNDTNNSMNSFIAAVEPPDAIVNLVSIKRKQSNVICDTISNKDVKKQRKNEKSSFYVKNSTDDNATKFHKNKNIVHSSINPQSTLKMTYNCKNKYDSNSEMFSETDSEEMIPDSEKEETDYIIVDSNDNLSLNSHDELIKSKFETRPAYEIEINKNDTKSITSTAPINVAEQNLLTPKLELKDEGLDIVEHGEEYFKTYDNSLQNTPKQPLFKRLHIKKTCNCMRQ